jgi:hypothetical protein
MPKVYPTLTTKRRYHKARIKLGFSPNAVGMIDWSRISKQTTFIWKCDSFEATARWVIEQTFAGYAQHPQANRLQIALHFVQRGFGIMQSDILGDQRSPVLVIPRYIAMVCLRRSGIARNDCARRFKRDYSVVKLAEDKVGALFEGISNVVENTLPIRPTPDGEQPRPIPA